eukprot:GEMP01012458.1.p1 GENE.GEMP01012458.1~~GEMP01012458.1.p1  ORF type:complete len:668 (+),score=166.86 GEMP01012458.1:107-2110(+)
MTFRLISPGNPLLSLKLEKGATPSIDAILNVVKKAEVSTENAQLLGRDGNKRVPLLTDANTVLFFEGADLPTIEILYNQLDAETYEIQVIKREKDRIESLEDENYRLTKTALDVEELIREMKENRQKEREEVRELMQAQATSLQRVVETASGNLEKKWADMVQMSHGLQAEVKAALKLLAASSDNFAKVKEEVHTRLDEFELEQGIVKSDNAATRGAMDHLSADIQNLRQSIVENVNFVKSFEATKVSVTQFDENNRSVSNIIKKLETFVKEVDSNHIQSGLRLKQNIDDNEAARIMDVQRVEKELQAAMEEAAKKRSEVCAVALQAVSDLKDVTQTRVQELQGSIKHQEETAQTQFETTSQHVSAMHADISAGHQKLSQETRDGDARIAEGMQVVVEQIEGMQVALQSAEETVVQLASRHDSESLAVKESVGALEAYTRGGMASMQEVIEGLAEKLTHFRQTFSKHLDILRQDSTAYHQTIAELEKAKTRLVGDWSAFSKDSERTQQESQRMDNILSKICRQLEPSTLEWRIDHVAEKIRTLPSPMNFRSSTAHVCGVQLMFDWFPNGNDQKMYKEGVCILRIYAPKATKIKFEVTLGTFTDGGRDWDTDVMDLWTDVVFMDWERSIARDSITFKVDILENMARSGGAGPSGKKAIRLRNDEPADD